MNLPAEIRPCLDSDEVDSFVLLSAFCAEQARMAVRDLDSTLAATRDRIEQSKQKIAASDLIIDDLSGFIPGLAHDRELADDPERRSAAPGDAAKTGPA